MFSHFCHLSQRTKESFRQPLSSLPNKKLTHKGLQRLACGLFLVTPQTSLEKCKRCWDISATIGCRKGGFLLHNICKRASSRTPCARHSSSSIQTPATSDESRCCHFDDSVIYRVAPEACIQLETKNVRKVKFR